MMEPFAWAVAAGAGLLTVAGICMLTRPMRSGFLKSWLRWVAAIVLLWPAPVPRFDAHYAPAFVVVLFEALLQRDGEPLPAAALLASGIVGATLVVGGYHYWRHRRRRRRAVSMRIEAP